MRQGWLVGVVLVFGCDPETTECTTEAVVSVVVTVTDVDGNTLTGATVTYSPADLSDACDEFSGTYNCGYELGGVVTVSAVLDGYQPASDTVTVFEDECHVRTEQVTLVLEPASG